MKYWWKQDSEIRCLIRWARQFVFIFSNDKTQKKTFWTNKKFWPNTIDYTNFALVAFMITTEYQLAVVPKIGKFVSVLQAVLSEFQPTISKNVSDIKMILWTRKSPLKYHTLTLGEFVSIFFTDFLLLIIQIIFSMLNWSFHFHNFNKICGFYWIVDFNTEAKAKFPTSLINGFKI